MNPLVADNVLSQSPTCWTSESIFYNNYELWWWKMFYDEALLVELMNLTHWSLKSLNVSLNLHQWFFSSNHPHVNFTRPQWSLITSCSIPNIHDNVIKWKHFPHYWPFVREIHRSLVNSTHKGQWHRALMFSVICTWINSWVNHHEAGDLRCHHAHYDVFVMWWGNWLCREFFFTLSSQKCDLLLTHLSLVQHICVTELVHHWFR